MVRARWCRWFVLLFAAAGVLRVALALKPGLWVDELFSIAMATGHSLEHPAAAADPGRGDFIQGSEALPPSAWRRYLQHGGAPASPARVVRAVYLSDTSPPVYYLLLSAWTRLFGTSDAALRLFSAAAALAAFPLLWSLGRYLGGRRAAVYGCLLFAFAPAAVYYSAEGRMYALTWFFGLALAATSVAIRRSGASPVRLALWSVAGAAGLLTHYFFAFVWLACAAWLLLHPGRNHRARIATAPVLSLLIALPWLVQVPATLAHWRVTGGWLDVPLTLGETLWSPIELAWSSFAVRGVWGGAKLVNRLAMLVFVGVAALQLRSGLRPLFRNRRRLVWFWFAASVFGILVFDLLRGTSTALNERYALPALPAAMLLAGITLARLPRRLAVTATAMVLLAWSSALVSTFTGHPRWWQPFSTIATRLESELSTGDLVIVHSIPSGVLGVARYLQREIPVAAWVEQLGERRPDHVEQLTAGACRVALVKVHALDAPSPAEAWLRTHATLYAGDQLVNVQNQVLYDLQYYRLDRGADTPGRPCPG